MRDSCTPIIPQKKYPSNTPLPQLKTPGTPGGVKNLSYVIYPILFFTSFYKVLNDLSNN